MFLNLLKEKAFVAGRIVRGNLLRLKLGNMQVLYVIMISAIFY